MKKVILDFFRRGAAACGLGPMVLAGLYWILKEQAGLKTLTVEEVCVGIFSLSALAFVAGGMNAIYQVERLHLMVAILIHGGVLYGSYLMTYLLNDWLDWNAAHILVFTSVFVLGYFVIWAVIYAVIRRRTERLNQFLENQRTAQDL